MMATQMTQGRCPVHQLHRGAGPGLPFWSKSRQPPPPFGDSEVWLSPSLPLPCYRAKRLDPVEKAIDQASRAGTCRSGFRRLKRAGCGLMLAIGCHRFRLAWSQSLWSPTLDPLSAKRAPFC